MERNPKGKPLGDAFAFIRGLADGSGKQKTWRNIQAETQYVPPQAWNDDLQKYASVGSFGPHEPVWQGPLQKSEIPEPCPTRSHAVIHGVETAIGMERKKKC